MNCYIIIFSIYLGPQIINTNDISRIYINTEGNTRISILDSRIKDNLKNDKDHGYTSRESIQTLKDRIENHCISEKPKLKKHKIKYENS